MKEGESGSPNKAHGGRVSVVAKKRCLSLDHDKVGCNAPQKPEEIVAWPQEPLQTSTVGPIKAKGFTVGPARRSSCLRSEHEREAGIQTF